MWDDCIGVNRGAAYRFSLPKPRKFAGDEAQTRKPLRNRSHAGATDTSQGRTDTYPKTTRRTRTCAAPSPGRVVLPRAEPSHRSHGPAVHGHAQRVSGRLGNVDGWAEAAGKVGRDGGGDAGTPVLSRLRSQSRRLLDGSNQVRRMDSKFLRFSHR